MDGLEPIYHDFRKFVWLVWRRILRAEPTPIQYEIAHWLQWSGERSFISAFRGVGKSWLTATFVDWIHAMSFNWSVGCDCPQCIWSPWNRKILPGALNVMAVSAGKDRSDEFTTFSRRVLEDVNEVKFLVPKIVDRGQRWSMEAFDVAGAPPQQAPSVRSRGIFGQITGGRADVLCFDDIEVPKTSETVTQRERLKVRQGEFAAILKPGGIVRGLGTFQNHDSVYNDLPERGYSMRIWPARYPPAQEVANYRGYLSPSIAEAVVMDEALEGMPTDTRFSHDDLLAREIEYGRTGFRLQFQLDTTLSDAERYPLKLRDLVVMDLAPDQAPDYVVWCNAPERLRQDLETVGFSGDFFHWPAMYSQDWGEYEGAILYVDPSGRGKDETAFCVAKQRGGVIYVPVCRGLTGGYEDQVLQTIAIEAKRHRVNLVLCEDNLGGGMFSELLKPHLSQAFAEAAIEGWVGHSCAVEEIHSTGQKERRILDVLEPVMNQHRLVLDTSVIRQDRKHDDSVAEKDRLQYELFYQMTRLTQERGCLLHDDRVEALAGACGYWVRSMSKDSTVWASKAQTRRIQDRIDEDKAEMERIHNKHNRRRRPNLLRAVVQRRY